jgi:hypothetical protein
MFSVGIFERTTLVNLSLIKMRGVVVVFRMDNPEKLATSDALAKITAQKTKKMSNRTPPKTGGPSHLRRASIPSIL